MKITNEFKVGMVVLVSIVCLTGLLVFVGDFENIIKDKKILTAYFTDAKGLKIGDPVFYAGMEAGSVTAMNLIMYEGVTHVEVECEVGKEVILRDDSKATVAATLTGITSLVIKVGKGQPTNLDRIVGTAPFEFSELADAGGDVMGKAGLLLSRLNDVVERTGPNVVETVADIRAMTGKMIESKTIDELSSAITNISGILKNKRPEIEELITNLNKAGKKLQDTLDTANGMLRENRTDVREIVGNVVKITTNFSALSQELRHRPWRLLHKPDKKEKNQITVYDLAQLMAEQAEYINDAVVRLSKLKAQTPEYDKVLQTLNHSLEKYQEAEKQFWQQLKNSEQ